MPSIPPLHPPQPPTPLLTLPPEVVRSLSPEVFKQGLHVYLRGMPGLEISIHILVGEDKLAPTQNTHCQPWAPTPAQKKRLCATWWTCL